MCLAFEFNQTAQAEGSLKDLYLGNSNTHVAINDAFSDRDDSREKLFEAEASIKELQKNLAESNAQLEVFRRKASEMSVRLESLGSAKLETRLLKLLGNLRSLENERRALRESLVSLWETMLHLKKFLPTEDVSMLDEFNNSLELVASVLGASSTSEVVPEVSISSPNRKVVSINDEMGIVVLNVGTKAGARVGMPFRIVRGGQNIGNVRIVDVREEIAGAAFLDLSLKSVVQVGDRVEIGIQNQR